MIPINNEIRFETTTRCNYNCLICPREKLTRKLETMDLAFFKFLINKITKETSQYNVCTFSGFGEPLLDPTIIEKVEFVRKMGLQALMLTNASLLSIEKFKRLDSLGLASIRVSFYGNSHSVYNKIHNITTRDLFEKIKNRLIRISGTKRNTKLLLTYNVEKDVNKNDLSHWIKQWQDKVDLLEVWMPHNWTNGRNYRKLQTNKTKTCGRPWRTPLQVQVDGTVNMCCFDYNGKLTLGDLKEQSLKEIFNSPLFKKIVQHHKSGDFKKSDLICAECDQRNADKSDVMIYNSKFKIEDRVKRVSTTYEKVMLD